MASLPRRIVLTGSESTGKTTLAAALAARLGTIWVPEYAREYAASRGGVLTVADLEPIARGQLAAEEAALGARGGPIVFDTDLLSTSVYGRYYYGATVPWIEAAIDRYPPSRYLLCEVDLPWTADGIRDLPGARGAVQAAFVEALERRHLPYRVVTGRGPDRLRAALAALEERT